LLTFFTVFQPAGFLLVDTKNSNNNNKKKKNNNSNNDAATTTKMTDFLQVTSRSSCVVRRSERTKCVEM